MTIPAIPLGTFTSLVVPAEVLSLVTFAANQLGLIRSYLRKLDEKVGVDEKSGIPLLPTKHIRALLEFPTRRYYIALGSVAMLAIGALFVYSVANVLPPVTDNGGLYDFLSLMTWLGLAPALVAYFMAFRIFVYVVDLWNETK